MEVRTSQSIRFVAYSAGHSMVRRRRPGYAQCPANSAHLKPCLLLLALRVCRARAVIPCRMRNENFRWTSILQVKRSDLSGGLAPLLID